MLNINYKRRNQEDNKKERMIIMKNVIKKVLSFVMVLALVMMAVPISEVKAYDGTEKGTITISGVTDGNEFKAYKIMEISYDTLSKDVSYSWVSQVASLIVYEGNPLTVEEFYEQLENQEEKQQQVLSAIPSADGVLATLTSIEADAAASSGTVTWSNVPLGGYLIVPTLSTDVYQIMTALVQPIYNKTSGEYETIGSTIQSPKNESISITKVVNGEADNVASTTGDDKIVTYEIEAFVPKYEGAEDTTFIIGDKLGDGLSIDAGSIAVTGIKTDGTEEPLDASDDYTYSNSGSITTPVGITLTGDYSSCTFMLEFADYSKISLYQRIKVTYNAQLVNGTAGEHHNDVVLKYSNYPFVEDSYGYEEDRATVKTYKIDITKVDKASPTTLLTGAKFDVYLDVTGVADLTTLNIPAGATTYTGGASGTVTELPDGTYIKVASDITDSVTTGHYIADQLDVGDYYFVETVVPSGFSKPTNAFGKYTVAESLDTSSYTLTNTIQNSSGFALPETGGTGTVIFTVVGVSLMCVAVLGLFILRKKEVSKN